MNVCRKPTRVNRAPTDGAHLHHGLTDSPSVDPKLARAHRAYVPSFTAAALDGSQTAAL